MSCGCRRNPRAVARRRNYGDTTDGVWSEERIARSLAVGLISEERAHELMAQLGTTSVERDVNREELVCKAMKGDAGAEAALRSYGLDWTQMTREQESCKKKKMMTYGAAAAGLGALAYFMSQRKK